MRLFCRLVELEGFRKMYKLQYFDLWQATSYSLPEQLVVADGYHVVGNELVETKD